MIYNLVFLVTLSYSFSSLAIPLRVSKNKSIEHAAIVKLIKNSNQCDIIESKNAFINEIVSNCINRLDSYTYWNKNNQHHAFIYINANFHCDYMATDLEVDTRLGTVKARQDSRLYSILKNSEGTNGSHLQLSKNKLRKTGNYDNIDDFDPVWIGVFSSAVSQCTIIKADLLKNKKEYITQKKKSQNYQKL